MGRMDASLNVDHLLGVLDDDARPLPPRDEVLAAAHAVVAGCEHLFGGGAPGSEGLRRDEPRLARLIWRARKALDGADPAEAARLADWLLELAKAGSAAACDYRGVLARRSGQWAEALEWFARAGNAGSARGWFNCGFTVLLRSTAEARSANRPDESSLRSFPEEALAYFEQGAAHGDSQSAYYLSRHWNAIAAEQVDAADAEDARAQADRYLEEAARAAEPSEYAFLDFAKLLRDRRQWDEAYQFAVRAIDSGPGMLQRKNRYIARWEAAKIAQKAPPGSIAGWDSVLAEVAAFRPVIGENSAGRGQDFDTLLEGLRSKSRHSGDLSGAARAAIASLPVDYAGVRVQDVFSPDPGRRPEAQREAFSRILRLLRGDAEDMMTALDLLDHLDQWSKHLYSLRVAYARDVANDAGLHWQRGQLLMRMGRHDQALAAFRHSAGLKDDPDHVGMCHERIGTIHEQEHRYAQAAQAFLQGLQHSRHAGLLVRFAQAKLAERPANNGMPMVQLLKFFVNHQRETSAEHGPKWRYEGADQALFDLPEIEMPLDADPDKTAIKLAGIVRVWQEAVPPDSGARDHVRRAREFVVDLLSRRIVRHDNGDGFPSDLVKTLAQYTEDPEAAKNLAGLMLQAAEIPTGEKRRFAPCAATHRANLIRLLQAVAAGCSAGDGFPLPVLRAAIRIICERPAWREERFQVALGLTAIVWRAVLGRYVRGAGGGAEAEAPAFRRWLIAEVLQPLAGIEDDTLRRKWLFELVVGDKASVEYVLSRRLIDESRSLLRPLLSSSSMVAVGEWVRSEGQHACELLANRVLLGTDSWISASYGQLDTDAGRWAHEVLARHVKQRLSVSYRRAGILLSAEATAASHGALPPLCAVEAAGTAMRLTADFFAPPALQAMGLEGQVYAVGIKIMADPMSPAPLALWAELKLRAPMPFDALVETRRRFRSRARHEPSARLQWDPARDRIYFEQRLDIVPHRAALPADWLHFLNDLKNEYDEYRSSGIALTGFFDSRWTRFPHDIEALRDNPAEYCRAWSWVLHTVCDRFWGLFMDRLVSRQEDKRSVLLLLHGLKSEVETLVDKEGRGNDEFKRQLSKVRNILTRLQESADSFLGQELVGWTPTLFDLRGVTERAIRDVFGERAEVRLTTGSDTRAIGASRPLGLVLAEVLQNARKYGTLREIAILRNTEVDWSISIATDTRAGTAESRGKSARASSGQGMLFARALCEEAGFYYWQSPQPMPGAPLTVVISRGHVGAQF